MCVRRALGKIHYAIKSRPGNLWIFCGAITAERRESKSLTAASMTFRRVWAAPSWVATSVSVLLPLCDRLGVSGEN